MKLEGMNVKELQNELKAVKGPKLSTQGKKDDLVKRLLVHKGIKAETTDDIMRCVEFYIVNLPKTPDSKIEEIIHRIHEL